MVGHSAASTATILVSCSFLRWSPAAIVPAEPVAETKAARRQPLLSRLQVLEDPVERLAGAVIMHQIIRELGELIENDVIGVSRASSRALVVDFLDVAFGARRADDVDGIGDPLLQPVEALAAHASGQNGDAAASENARDRDAAAAIISGRRPDRAVVRRIETAR